VDDGHMSDERPDDPGQDIDMGDTARQIGLFESANGIPHGIVEIVIAILLALAIFPLRAAWRWLRGTGDRPA
jgi:hypothetical protein